MCVVAAHVTLLRKRTVEEAPRLEIELRDPNVLGQLPALEGIEVLQFGVATEEPLRERLHKAPFEFALPARSGERERSENVQVNGRILTCPPEELVYQMVRLAESERCAEGDAPSDLAERLFDAGLHIPVVVGALVHRSSSCLARS